jgi:hypothetical protein
LAASPGRLAGRGSQKLRYPGRTGHGGHGEHAGHADWNEGQNLESIEPGQSFDPGGRIDPPVENLLHPIGKERRQGDVGHGDAPALEPLVPEQRKVRKQMAERGVAAER